MRVLLLLFELDKRLGEGRLTTATYAAWAERGSLLDIVESFMSPLLYMLDKTFWPLPGEFRD